MQEIREESKKTQVKDGNPSMQSIRSIFMHADAIDCTLMAIGCIGAIGDGMIIPIALLLFGIMLNHIGYELASPSFLQNIYHVIILFLYLGAAAFVVSFLEGYCWTRTGARQASRMRVRYLKAVLRQDVGYFSLKVASTTEVVSNVSNDSLLIQDFLCEKVPNFIMSLSTFFACYVMAFTIIWRLAVVMFPTTLLLIIPSFIYGRVLLGLARANQLKYHKASEIAEQAISSISTVYAFTAEQLTIESFSTALKKSVQIGLRQGLNKGLAIGSTGINFAIWSLMVWYNSRLVMYHGAKGGTAYFAGVCILTGGVSLGSGLSNIKYFGEAIAAAERIKDVIDRWPAIALESDEGEEIGEVEGEVEFREVGFAYPARPDTEILRGLNLKVPAGRTLALVGGSGSGKSTVIALLQRFYDPSHGEILLDGVDIRRLRLKWLRAQMGLVSQEPTLFATSIKENILLGREDATMEEVIAAAKVANASEFISQLPHGYDTQVGDRGIQLSGGQKQRIAIARAIIRSPKILLLDEATSALDPHSERLVQQAIDAAAADRTTIIIAHRLSTIRNADSIAIVQAGQVIEAGSHEELYLRPESHYSSLIHLQESQSPPDSPNGASRSSARARNRSRSSNLSHCSSPSSNQHSFSVSNWSVVDEDVKHVKLKLSFWRLLKLTAPEWRQAALGCLGAVLTGAIQPIYGFSVGSISSIYFLKDNDEIKDRTRTYALLVAALSVYCFLVNILQHFNFASVSEYLTKRLREQTFSKILTFEVGWFDQEENSAGALCSRLADASAVRSLVTDWMSLVIQTFSNIAIAYIMALLISWRLALVMISVQPLVILCFYAKFALLKGRSKKAMESMLESRKLAAEAISNFHNVAAFSSQDRILHLFELAQIAPRREGIRQSWIVGACLGSSQCIGMYVAALGFWYGGLLVYHGYIVTSDLFQILPMLMTTGRSLAEACAMTTDITNGMNSIASVFTILERSTRVDPDKPKGHKPKSLIGHVKLSNVEFAYPSRPDVAVLRQFSLSVKAGRSTALVGPSGSGKSTIIGLIERFYDPLHGVVYIDGKDLRSYNLRYLRRHLALVGQEPVLFAGTVRENITYGIEGVGDGELEAAARAANAHDFICSLANGYETSCGERGTQLSGGQKQRIAIARAIVRNPRILLLDEATSALDGPSEKVIQDALENVMVGRTSVVVAHRLSTVKNCDVIAVLDKGVLVEKGSHTSLMAKGPMGMYYGLVSLQSEVNNN